MRCETSATLPKRNTSSNGHAPPAMAWATRAPIRSRWPTLPTSSSPAACSPRRARTGPHHWTPWPASDPPAPTKPSATYAAAWPPSGHANPPSPSNSTNTQRPGNKPPPAAPRDTRGRCYYVRRTHPSRSRTDGAAGLVAGRRGNRSPRGNPARRPRHRGPPPRPAGSHLLLLTENTAEARDGLKAWPVPPGKGWSPMVACKAWAHRPKHPDRGKHDPRHRETGQVPAEDER